MSLCALVSIANIFFNIIISNDCKLHGDNIVYLNDGVFISRCSLQQCKINLLFSRKFLRHVSDM